MPDLSRERHCLATRGGFAVGLDEVGRGALAGPVVAAAVLLHPWPPAAAAQLLRGVDDSKRLSAARREALAPGIRAVALAHGIGEASAEEVDTLGIAAANAMAMRRALDALLGERGERGAAPPVAALIDGYPLPDFPLPQEGIVGGDRASLSIAAASILAKVYRDALMRRLAEEHPGYGLERHKGYGTAAHRQAIAALGPSPVHRRSWQLLPAEVDAR